MGISISGIRFFLGIGMPRGVGIQEVGIPKGVGISG